MLVLRDVASSYRFCIIDVDSALCMPCVQTLLCENSGNRRPLNCWLAPAIAWCYRWSGFHEQSCVQKTTNKTSKQANMKQTILSQLEPSLSQNCYGKNNYRVSISVYMAWSLRSRIVPQQQRKTNRNRFATVLVRQVGYMFSPAFDLASFVFARLSVANFWSVKFWFSDCFFQKFVF